MISGAIALQGLKQVALCSIPQNALEPDQEIITAISHDDIGDGTRLVVRVHECEQLAAAEAGRLTAQRAADVAQRAQRIGRE